jgi:DNA-binding PadR family transcriptional regulator
MFNRPFFQFERRSRLFEKGDLKYVILNLLKDKPSHGYEIIRALEELFHGFYTPSAGSVYPTLQMLNDMGYVNAAEHDGKKIYTITDEGKQFLKDQKDIIEKIQNQMKEWWGPGDIGDFHETIHELRHLGRMVGQRAHNLGTEKWAKIKEVVTRARHEIEDILEKQ